MNDGKVPPIALLLRFLRTQPHRSIISEQKLGMGQDKHERTVLAALVDFPDSKGWCPERYC
jgi:hypothetical protein